MVYGFDCLFFFQWKADINNALSGRILRLNVTCNYTETNNRPLNGCLLIKAVGAVTCEYTIIQTRVCYSHQQNLKNTFNTGGPHLIISKRS